MNRATTDARAADREVSTASAAEAAWGRLHKRTEFGLGRLDLLASHLFVRSLEDGERAEAVEITRLLATIFGTLRLSTGADLLRRVASAFEIHDADIETGVAIASLLDDVRSTIALAVEDVLSQIHDGPLVAVLGGDCSMIDELVWVATSHRMSVVRSGTDLREGLDDVEAFLLVDPTGPIERLQPTTRALREINAEAPIVVVAPPGTPTDQVKVARAADLLLNSDTPPFDVVQELRRLITRQQFPRTVDVFGEKAEEYAEKLKRCRIDAVATQDISELRSRVANGSARAVLLTDVDFEARSSGAIHILRSNRLTQPAPIVRLALASDRALYRRALRSGADVVLDATSAVEEVALSLRSVLARRADWDSHVPVDERHSALPWLAARVVIERMLMTAFRRHSPVGLAVVRLSPELIEDPTIEETLAAEFRLGDVVTRPTPDRIVIALNGTGHEVAVRRVEAALSARGDAAAAVRAAVAEFPVDGRSLDDLKERAEEAVDLSARSVGPRTVSVGWHPDESDAAHVLLVDPDVAFGRILQSTLGRRGLRLEQETEAHDALDRLTGFSNQPLPKSVLVELNLLGMDGFQFLRTLRDAGTMAKVPVLVTSARASETDVRRSLEFGAEDYISKPVNAALLTHRLDRVLSR